MNVALGDGVEVNVRTYAAFCDHGNDIAGLEGIWREMMFADGAIDPLCCKKRPRNVTGIAIRRDGKVC